MAEVAKVLITINLKSKHSWTISNANKDIVGNLELIAIKKYWKCDGQIQDEVDWLPKD